MSAHLKKGWKLPIKSRRKHDTEEENLAPPDAGLLLRDNPATRSPLRIIPRVLRLFRWVVMAALGLACIGVFYVAVILGETPEAQQAGGELPTATAVPAAPALPGGARELATTDLAQLAALLPARLATLPRQQGFQLEGGKVENYIIQGASQACRVVTLTYLHPTFGTRVVVHSAVPGTYIQRFAQQSFTLSPSPVTMGALQAMAITVGDHQYYVATSGEAVYAIEGMAGVPELDSVPGWLVLSGAAPVAQPAQPNTGGEG